MHRIRVHRVIAHDWLDLFKLVLDVRRYPAFVPGCRDVRLLHCEADGSDRTVIVSRMTVGFPPVEVSYANRTVGDATARRVDVQSIDGPLRRLHVVWRFDPQGEHGTDVAFSAEYEFSSHVLSAVASGALERMFGRIVDAFERRADLLLQPHRALSSLGRDSEAGGD